MQGMRLLILNAKGIPINHGTIVQTITSKKYLCRFATNPVVSRIVGLKELQTFQLFSDDDEMSRFIAAITKLNPPVNSEKE